MSEQQHNENLRRIYEREYEFSNSSILPECTAFNKSILRHFLPECIAPRTTRGCHTEPSSYFAWIPARKISCNQFALIYLLHDVNRA